MNKKGLLIFFIIILVGCSCCLLYKKKGTEEIKRTDEINKGKKATRINEIEKALQAYDEFIAGERNVGNEDIFSLSTPTGEPESRYATNYAILDMNGDGIPELNIATGREFNVISYKNGELYILASGFPNPGWQEVLKSGALMGFDCRQGYYWHYFQLDMQGNEINEVRFSIAEIYLGEDKYQLEYKFGGRLCTKEEWYAKTREYLYTDEEGREQIRNTVDWIRYCDAK